MKFKQVESLLNETNISTIWKRTQDTSTFAIIGSQDKDSKEDRRDELIVEVRNLAAKHPSKIGYKYLFGAYQYEDGSIAEELSVIIFNPTFDQALSICKKLNQESFIWKDEKFFGFVENNGEKSDQFSKEAGLNFSDEDIKLFGSRLARHKNRNQLKPFKFVMEQYKPVERNSVRNLANGNMEREVMLSLDI